MTERSDKAAHSRTDATSMTQDFKAAQTREDGLTDDEGVVSDALVRAVEAWARLPRQHPQEINEFVTAIHACQGLLTTRIARRLYPKGWPTHAS